MWGLGLKMLLVLWKQCMSDIFKKLHDVQPVPMSLSLLGTGPWRWNYWILSLRMMELLDFATMS